ncbi:MAG: thioredoxin [Hungatella sp.]|jgi:thioredoxin 1|nr:thioredoxin [Hungatella sp.]
MSILHVNNNNFDSVKTSDKPVLLDFYADWCGPCRMVAPVVEQIAEENPQYLIGKINVDKEPELARKFNVLSIPTLVVLKDGKIISQSAGARPKADILALLERA